MAIYETKNSIEDYLEKTNLPSKSRGELEKLKNSYKELEIYTYGTCLAHTNRKGAVYNNQGNLLIKSKHFLLGTEYSSKICAFWYKDENNDEKELIIYPNGTYVKKNHILRNTLSTHFETCINPPTLYFPDGKKIFEGSNFEYYRDGSIFVEDNLCFKDMDKLKGHTHTLIDKNGFVETKYELIRKKLKQLKSPLKQSEDDERLSFPCPF